MKNYFIPGVMPGMKQKLAEAHVDFCELTIDGAQGAVIDQENIPKALTALGMRIKTEQSTSIDGIVRVELEVGRAPPPPEVEIPPSPVKVTVDERSYFRCDHWKNFRGLVTQHLICCVTNNNFSEIRVVFISGNNFSAQDLMHPEKGVFSLVISKEASGDSSPLLIIDSAHKAEYIPGSRYLRIFGFPECPNEGTQNETEWFVKIFNELLPVVVETDPAKISRIRKQIFEERRRRSREQYVAECQKRFEKTVKGTREKVSTGHVAIDKLQAELIKTIRETRGAERKLEQIESARGGELEKYASEFNSLISVPGVEDVQVADGVVKVFTENIFITPITPDDSKSETYDIGKFRMEIYTAGTNGCIKFFNLTQKGGGDNYNINHPHVNSQGNPCLGNIKELVAELIAGYEFSAVAQLGLQFLKSVNLDDSAGSGIFNAWPKKDRKEGE